MSISINGNGITSANIADGAITNADIADVAASKLTGALPAISGAALTNLPGGGKVLQVLIVEDATEMTLSSDTYTNTNLSLSITPSSASSKILAMWNVQAGINSTDGGWGTQLKRGSTPIYASASKYDVYSGSNSAHMRQRGDYKHLDSPNTTSAITYTVQVATYTSLTCRFNNAGNQTQLVLMEIGA